LKKLTNIGFYLITDSTLSKNGVFSDVENAVKAGCKIVQYREKNKSKKDMIAEAEKLKQICNGRAIFLVNDSVDIACDVNADGVHIGQSDIPIETARGFLGKDKIIGLTVHNIKEAIEAVNLGADYIGLAPIFATDTKDDAGCPCGVEMISKVRKQVSLPIVAVGGINKNNMVDVLENGADSVVSISPVIGVDDVYGEVEGFIKIIQEYKSK